MFKIEKHDKQKKDHFEKKMKKDLLTQNVKKKKKDHLL